MYTDHLSHGVPPPDRRGLVLQGPHRLLARQQGVGPVRGTLMIVGMMNIIAIINYTINYSEKNPSKAENLLICLFVFWSDTTPEP